MRVTNCGGGGTLSYIGLIGRFRGVLSMVVDVTALVNCLCIASPKLGFNRLKHGLIGPLVRKDDGSAQLAAAFALCVVD